MKALLPGLCMMAFLAASPAASAQAVDTPWLRENTWAFGNMDSGNVSWDNFRATFVGVAPNPAGDFDQIFYNDLYKDKLFNAGFCYGMDVMAMLMMSDGGWMGFCHPPYIYPARSSLSGALDPKLVQAIMITHGNQINRGFLVFLLDVIAAQENRDGNYAYYQVGKYLAQGDQPVISVSQSLIPTDSAHVLVPYYEDVSGSIKRIFVYDPNRSIYVPGSDRHDYYANGSNFIAIKSDGTWSYHFNDLSVPPWTGNPSSGGNCIAIPLSVAGRKDRLPQSLFADAQLAINTIFIFGRDVHVRQVTAGDRRYMNGREVAFGKNALTTILPFQTSGRNPNDTLQVYFVRGIEPQCWEIEAHGPYRVEMFYAGQHTAVSGVGNGDRMRFYTPLRPVINQSRR